MIYENIKKCCALKGISISQLEIELKMARGSLCKIDRHKPSQEKMSNIANYLGVSVDYLIGNEESQQFDMPKYDYMIHELIEKFSLLSDKQKNLVLDVVEQFATVDFALINSNNDNIMCIVESKTNHLNKDDATKEKNNIHYNDNEQNNNA